MTLAQAIEQANALVIPGVRGLGTMALHTPSGRTYGILSGNILVDPQGNVIAATDIADRIEKVTTTTDELGGLYY